MLFNSAIKTGEQPFIVAFSMGLLNTYKIYQFCIPEASEDPQCFKNIPLE